VQIKTKAIFFCLTTRSSLSPRFVNRDNKAFSISINCSQVIRTKVDWDTQLLSDYVSKSVSWFHAKQTRKYGPNLFCFSDYLAYFLSLFARKIVSSILWSDFSYDLVSYHSCKLMVWLSFFWWCLCWFWWLERRCFGDKLMRRTWNW
jgi:hypothetical protein